MLMENHWENPLENQFHPKNKVMLEKSEVSGTWKAIKAMTEGKPL